MQSQDEGLGYPTERGKDKYASRMTNGNRGDTAFGYRYVHAVLLSIRV